MVQAQRRIHFTMAFIGGFLGVYTTLRFAGLFGSAQTANLIYLATDLLGGSWTDMLLRLGGAVLYMAGIALTVWLPLGPVRDLRRLSVGIDMAAAILVALLPAEISPVLGLYPLFFAMPFNGTAFLARTSSSAPAFFPPTISASSPWRWPTQSPKPTSGPRRPFTARRF